MSLCCYMRSMKQAYKISNNWSENLRKKVVVILSFNKDYIKARSSITSHVVS